MDPVALIKRLALIRYLYKTAERQAQLPLPTGALAVLSFHDCIEWFIITAGEHLDINVAHGTLIEQFDRIATTTRLSNKAVLVKVISTRKELKHRLTIPALSSVLEICNGTKIFLIENSSVLFEVNFEDLSLKDLVQDTLIKRHVENALALREKKDYIESMHEIAYANARVIEKFRLNMRPGWPHACGVDSLELFYFDRLIPTYNKQAFAAFDDGCDFCLDFIIDATIKLEQTMSNAKIEEMEDLVKRFHQLTSRDSN